VIEAPAPAAILVPPGVVHAFHFAPNTQGVVLTLAASWATATGDGRVRASFDGLLDAPMVLDLGEDAERVRGLLDLLSAEARDGRAGSELMSEWLVGAVLVALARRRLAADAPAPANDPRALLFTRFRALIEDHYAERWSVARYAEALAITESRLDRLCRALAGRSAFDVVQNRVLLEARRRLVHVAAPVSALAYELGFEDPAYFCRFFKRHVGSTPTDWRRAQRRRLAGEGEGGPR
jgi:AraC family transcriptional activator of pobA